jgi:hypothetical protein
MAEGLSNKMNKFPTAALAICGWLVFVLGISIGKPMWLKLILLSAARVLP